MLLIVWLARKASPVDYVMCHLRMLLDVFFNEWILLFNPLHFLAMSSAETDRRQNWWEGVLRTSHFHPVHQYRPHGFRTVVVGVRAYSSDAHQHVFKVAGDGDFFYRKSDLPFLNPKA